MPGFVPDGKLNERSDRDHFEVFLAGTAFRAGPVDGHVVPAGPGRNAFFRQACFLVVDPTTDQAHPGFEFGLAAFAIGHG